VKSILGCGQADYWGERGRRESSRHIRGDTESVKGDQGAY
jgi:hypothetical protein